MESRDHRLTSQYGETSLALKMAVRAALHRDHYQLIINYHAYADRMKVLWYPVPGGDDPGGRRG